MTILTLTDDIHAATKFQTRQDALMAAEKIKANYIPLMQDNTHRNLLVVADTKEIKYYHIIGYFYDRSRLGWVQTK